MNSSQNSVDLIYWNSCTEMVMDKTYGGHNTNNPFDTLEVKAANMNPLDDGVDQSPFKDDPPCCNFFSPVWERDVRQDISEVIKEQISLCNEEEKEQIREETRTKIKLFIEQEILKYKKKCSPKSFTFCSPQCKDRSDVKNNTSDKSLLNKRFLIDRSLDTNSFNSNKTSNVTFVISNNNTSYGNLELNFEELHSFDLDLVEPNEWIYSFNWGSLNNESIGVHTDAGSMTELKHVDINQSDMILEAPNPIGNDEQNESKTVKSLSTTKITNKSLFNAHVSLPRMNQSDDGIDLKQFNCQPDDSQLKPVASSTPCRSNLARQSLPYLIRSPIVPLNVTKFLKKPSTYSEHKVKDSMVLNSSKRNSEHKVKDSMVLNSNKRSGLPLFQQSKKLFKSNKNVKPE